ncbi:MAG: beta-ketoacyl synthase [Candidatus Endonucleobacter bathymodioli]|uniref:Beta-ketoacyl synthase n=1 Tax=Candidatus Endonucleibacter bathymodioli TaxID=539814 RepID=A0AA90NR91_9GAMM|nr:beta-ketoacyl synthase [Candidatus Endonucleobacter bathymodioli]
MTRLPVIVAQGGISPAGRTSGFHGYRRLIIDKLGEQDKSRTLAMLACLGGYSDDVSEQEILEGSLVRRLEKTLFDSSALYHHRRIELQDGTMLVLSDQRLLNPLPKGWVIERREKGRVHIRVSGSQSMMLPSSYPSAVNAAGQLPRGFQPEKLYQSRNHPRSLAMTVYSASDAIVSAGLDWSFLRRILSPDEIAVYAGSAMSQMDYNGNGGLLQARLLGRRVTSKQCPFGFAEMSADFINAYILGSLGATGTSMGACATLLYNLQQGVADIHSGRRRIVVVGSSEAPIIPEIIDGYFTMGALASDDALRQLDQLSENENPNWRNACRPFGNNCGFTLAESAQYFILMDDELAVECGAEILGAVGDVFINADGYKKSIASPGAGNYLTVARAAALGRSIVGEDVLRHGSFVQAHGTGTPQNRVTESQILNDVACAFGIGKWPVSAVKSYVGHSLGAAAGDQIMSTLGVWRYGWLPGIKTMDSLAEDVVSQRLNIIVQNHYQVDTTATELALINAKGFGGNNATALMLSPHLTVKMLNAKHGQKVMGLWQAAHENVCERQQDYERQSLAGTIQPMYQFGMGVLAGSDLTMDDKQISVPGYGKPINLEMENPFWSY